MKTNDMEMVMIVSIEQAHTLLRERKINDADLDLVCDMVTNSDSIVGSATDYHNLAVEMTKRGFYLHGFHVVTKGLKLYPYNIDLLADAVYYGSCAGKFEACEMYAAVLHSRPYALWNWRAYTFMIDYYIDRADWTESETEILQSMSKAMDLAKMAQQILTTEERGYLAEHQVHEALERWNRESAIKEPQKSQEYLEIANAEHRMSIDILKKAIDNEKIVAVQCCLRYADLKFEAREYEETIKVCDRAFSYGESQPSARMGYFLYLAAMSMDALIHANKAFEDEERVMECYRMYQAAEKTIDNARATYLSNIRLRVNNLEVRTGIPSYIQNKDDKIDINTLRTIMSSLKESGENEC